MKNVRVQPSPKGAARRHWNGQPGAPTTCSIMCCALATSTVTAVSAKTCFVPFLGRSVPAPCNCLKLSGSNSGKAPMRLRLKYGFPTLAQMTPEEFADAKSLWKFFYANECFKHVENACSFILQSGMDEKHPAY